MNLLSRAKILSVRRLYYRESVLERVCFKENIGEFCWDIGNCPY